MCRSTNRRGSVLEPEVWFRIVHVAPEAQDGAPVAAYREQEVEIALSPIGIIEDGRVGTLTRRIETDQVVSVVPLTRGNLNQPTAHKTPRVTALLLRAIEWRRQIDAGEVENKAEIARREGITRARVTQIMGMLRLSPQIQEHLLSMPNCIRRPSVSERMLRPNETITDSRAQVLQFHKLLVKTHRRYSAGPRT
jgi:hypothetical protein